MAVPTPPVPTLTDGTVTLRALDDGDVPGVLEQCLDPQSIRWTQVPVPFGLTDALEFVHEIAPGAWADGSQWIFCVDAGPGGLPDGSRYAGNVALRDEGRGRAEIAYGAHPVARGTGVMEAGLRLLLEWGFGRMGLETIIWRADVGNWASRKLAWRLGFSLDGVLRGSQFSRGRLVDAWVGTLLRGDPREPSRRWFTVPVLEGDGLRLRPFRSDDVDRIVEACSDERTRQWLGRLPAPFGEAEARCWLGRQEEGHAAGEQVFWAVADADSDVLLASLELFDIDEVAGELGYWTHPDARGRGVMTRAVHTATSWAFDDLGLQRMRLACAPDNAASRRVAEANGFRQYAVERLSTTTREGRGDVVRYDVLVTEWPRSVLR
jgi:RimJ/RimL family protein N-acetyltransferase